ESTLSWAIGESNVTFTIEEDSLSGDNVKLKLYREQSGVKAYDLTSVDESVAKTVTVTIPNYLPQGSYVIGVELADESLYPDNGNYTLSTTNTSQYRKTFVVKGQGLALTEDNMPWVYKYTDKDGMENKVDVLAQNGVSPRKAELTYTGYEYEFTVDTEALLALGAEIDTSKGVDGFTGDTKWKNATTAEKTITVYWKTAEGYESASGSYDLKYYIEKAKYDLTNTKWDYTSPYEYDPLQFRKVEIIDLPTGLSINSADYVQNSNRQKNAGKYTAELLSIQNSNTNYYTPMATNKDTYIYNKDDNEFPWKLEWEITSQKLNLTWTTKASENNDFTYWEVSGAELEQIAGYKFYANSDYNNTIGEATGDDIELSDIVVPKKQIDVYWVVAVLKDANNYEIVSGKAQRFTVGSLKEMVKVELKDTQPFIYNGNVYGQDIIVTSDEGTLTAANIVRTYYKDSVSAD
ncbi:MAG: hypothetical protein K2J13_01730, partial [Clostridia bacterium]|nr:hypothetical protein [Clostridia bacterium]